MSKVLKIDEMLEVLNEIGHPQAADFVAQVEILGDSIAQAIADALNVNHGPSAFDMGETCAAFTPKFRGQRCPEAIDTKDAGGEWDDEDDGWRCPNCDETAQDGSGICITCGAEGSE